MEWEGTTDEELAERYYQCDDAAYTELYARYFPLLAAWFALRVEYMVACDLAHQTLVKSCLTKHGETNRFDGRRGKFRSWIFRIASNLLIDHLRNTGRVIFSEFDEVVGQSSVIEETAESRLSVEDKLIWQEFCEAVKGCIRELDPVLAYVVLQRAAGLTLAEIAAQLKLSPATVDRYEQKAGRLLKECLERRGYGFIPKGA